VHEGGEVAARGACDEHALQEAPVLYIQRSPGWCISGSVPERRIHSSGACGVIGTGLSFTSSSAVIARWIGSDSSNVAPKPSVKVSRSRTVIGRRAGTVSPTGPSSCRRTRRCAISGSQRSAGASSVSTPSSTSIITAVAVIGFVIDAMRKIVSRRIGAVPPSAVVPTMSTATSSPCATSHTAPGNSPCATAGPSGRALANRCVDREVRIDLQPVSPAASAVDPDAIRNLRLVSIPLPPQR
jgi:hypothetical protein